MVSSLRIAKQSTLRVFFIRRKLHLVASTGALLIASAALAQGGLRTLSGTVTTAGHEPLRGAVVELIDEKTDQVESYVTDITGRYSFKRVQPGTDYHFFATYRGHRSRQKRLGMFDSKTNATVNLTIMLD